ncbi:BnaC08g41030D [Brassica napus]|uniref:BnaC08g41030D protein n=2 Tax=Brassica napus TaxID=3708 RepID=A0A078FNM8_BRANA|nr:BnaC08g41030D [Brassica napus]
MDSKRMALLVVMMLVMGNILFEAEGMAFIDCYKGCFVMCAASSNAFKKLFCPFSCIKDCKQPTTPSEANLNDIDHTDYFCNLGCATDRCASSSSIHDKDHAEKVSVCVDSCSDICSRKN